MPVSYTQLDVYKRQGKGRMQQPPTTPSNMTTIPTKKDINPTPGNLDELTALKHFHGKSPVSYTHLDVYKRQGKSWDNIQSEELRLHWDAFSWLNATYLSLIHI